MEEELYRRALPHFRSDAWQSYFVTWRSARTMTPEERTLVADALKFFQGERYWLAAYVVMNDHVHALVTPFAGVPLEKVIHSWKSFSAHAVRRMGGAGPLWQAEYFDRTVVGVEAATRVMNYILGNPSRRWPDARERYPWAECWEFQSAK